MADSRIEPPQAKSRSLATVAQIKAIYAIARSEHELSEEELDERCRQTYGRCPAELTKREASSYIDKLKAG